MSFTVHSLPAPALPEERRTRSGRLKMLLVLAVCAAPVIASYFTYFLIRPEGRTNYSELILPPRALPALSLRDLHGAVVAADSLKGQWLLVVVADAACDAGCERSLYQQRQLRETLGRDKDRLDKVWLVPDGAPIRPEVEQAVTAAPPVTVLRADRAELTAWLAPAEGHRLDEHFYIVDPNGAWMMRAPAQPELPRLKRDIERLMRASAGWDREGR